MGEKKRFPYQEALAAALKIRDILTPFCEKCVIAGSIRRHRAYVGDIELLYIPKLVPEPRELLPCLVDAPAKLYNATDEAIDQMVSTRILSKRKNIKGSFIWGEQNKLAVHVASGIPVDLFSTTPEKWFMALVIRTGGKQTNVALAVAARARGMKLNPYGEGYTVLHSGRVIPCHSEFEVFNFVGLPFNKPEHRS